MHVFVARRMLLAIPTVLGVILVVVIVLRLAPGDPVVALFLGGDASAAVDMEVVERVRQQMGLDRPIHMQYLEYIRRAVLLDFGRSFWSGEEIRTQLLRRWPATLELGISALIIAYVAGITGGILSALFPVSWVDRVTMFFSVLGQSLPSFWLGFLLMILFGLTLEWLPISGRGGPPWTLEGLKHLAMPAFTLSVGPAALVARLFRSGLLESMRADYIRVARAKGVSERRVVLVHAVRNALLPVLAVMGLQLGLVLGGSVIVEMVFNWPGLGRYAVRAIQNRDYPIVQACVMVVAFVYILGNLLADVVSGWVDPRIRYD